MFLLAVIFCSFTASAVVSPPSAYCAVLFVSVFEFLIPVMSSFEYLFYTFLQNSPSVGVCSSLFVFSSSSMPGDGVNATGNCALPVEQLVVPLSVCVSVANGNLCMHHAKISERNQCQSRFRSPICDYIIRRQMSSLAFFGGAASLPTRGDATRRDAGACIINNEMIWTLTLAKSLSQVRNGVEVETRESQRVAAATARLTQLFQLSDCCWCCCCCFCCIYCRMVGLMSVCPFVCLSVCLAWCCACHGAH